MGLPLAYPSLSYSILAATLYLVLDSPQLLHVRFVRKPCLLLAPDVIKLLVSFRRNGDRFFMAYRSWTMKHFKEIRGKHSVHSLNPER